MVWCMLGQLHARVEQKLLPRAVVAGPNLVVGQAEGGVFDRVEVDGGGLGSLGEPR